MPEVEHRPAVAQLVRRQVLLSAAINAGMSVVFFLTLYGWPGRSLTFAAPDRLALDFLPQFGMVGLMSALVPPLVSRAAFAAAEGGIPRPPARIVLAAAGWALTALALGGAAAWASLALPVAAIGGWTALALKTALGAVLGAGASALALRPMFLPLRSS